MSDYNAAIANGMYFLLRELGNNKRMFAKEKVSISDFNDIDSVLDNFK